VSTPVLNHRWSRRRVLLSVQAVVLGVVALLWVYPLLWTLSASVRDAADLFSGGVGLWPAEWHWENYARAWNDANFSTYLVNSTIVSTASVVLVVVRSATAGYVLARYRFFGRKVVLAVLIGTTFVPTGLSIVPVVELSDLLGLLNTRLGLVLALSAGTNVAAILLYTGYYAKIPRELEEAAVVDGAGFLRTFVSVMLPLSGPVTATVAVMTFLGTWSNYFVPLVFTLSTPSQRTLAVGMTAFQSTDSTDWSGLAAAATISLVPVLLVFLLLQRYFVEGVAGAVKN
jgi:ABC-type glycerol-3-phosphate transport system permease component